MLSVMKKTAKILSFILPLFMIIAVLVPAAVPASAGGGALIDDKVQIFVACPVEGEALVGDKYEPVLVNSPNCSIYAYTWEDLDENRLMEATDPVVAGKTYRLVVTVLPKTDTFYSFDPTSTRVIVNGEDPYYVSFDYPWVPRSILVTVLFVGAMETWYPYTMTEEVIDLTSGSLKRFTQDFEPFRITMAACEYAGLVSIQADDERIAYDLNKDGYTEMVLYDASDDGVQLMEITWNEYYAGNGTIELNPAAYEYLSKIRAYGYAESIRILFDVAEAPVLPFTDVTLSDPFYSAIYWAYYTTPQVTTGVTDTRFGTYDTVTRGQAVTFLWRAMGCPEPKGDPESSKFVDLEADYYKKAIQWAVENGITKGVDSTHFSPNGTLSIAHMVTFLYRTLGIGTDGWYSEAANWALNINLTEDVTYTINPNIDCPRYAVVLMLWRTVGGLWTP